MEAKEVKAKLVKVHTYPEHFDAVEVYRDNELYGYKVNGEILTLGDFDKKYIKVAKPKVKNDL